MRKAREARALQCDRQVNCDGIGNSANLQQRLNAMEAERMEGEKVLRLIRSPTEFGTPLVHARRREYDLRKEEGSGDDDLGACRT